MNKKAEGEMTGKGLHIIIAIIIGALAIMILTSVNKGTLDTSNDITDQLIDDAKKDGLVDGYTQNYDQTLKSGQKIIINNCEITRLPDETETKLKTIYGQYVTKYIEQVNKELGLKGDNAITEKIVWGLMWTESKGKANAGSEVGAQGLMQIMSSSASASCSNCNINGDYKDPEKNICCGIYILGYSIKGGNKASNYDSCKNFPEVVSYSGIDAGLRGYNGWGCSSQYFDRCFVHKVKTHGDMFA